ncbi:MAG TPA: efflux RND transporter periplasmic adaptor subunit, partial [Myxococcaceae bacterium]|nr:efflux RND transporter periplasmic adaptor subunit [Myxococcaceae bacterium]
MNKVKAGIGVFVVAVLLGGIKFSQISKLISFGEAMAKAGPPPEVVATAQAEQQDWENTVSAVGTLSAVRGVTVSNEGAGVVSAIKFESGKQVKQGQVLVELDTGVERAQLASAQARLGLARTSAERTRSLAEQGSVPKSQLDADEAQLQSAEAEVATLQAQIARKVVRAPFDGKLGIRQINLGQYLN